MQKPHPLDAHKRPVVDPALVYDGVSAEQLALFHPTGLLAASLCPCIGRSHDMIVIFSTMSASHVSAGFA